jgi:hypothetical protein
VRFSSRVFALLGEVQALGGSIELTGRTCAVVATAAATTTAASLRAKLISLGTLWV